MKKLLHRTIAGLLTLTMLIQMAWGNLATIFGGGPADELVKFQDSDLSVIRCWPLTLKISNPDFIFDEKGIFAYGNNSSADYFAEAVAVLVYNPNALPQNVEIWLSTLIDLTWQGI